MTNCPHRNPDCRPGTPCTPCSGGGVLRDGEGIVVPMMLRDSAHGGLSEYHAQALAASARSNAAALEEAQRQHDVMQAVRDHHGNAADLAYAESVAAFDRKHNEA